MDTGSLDTPRWAQRFDNFTSALVLLREAVELVRDPHVISIVREGALHAAGAGRCDAIKRFGAFHCPLGVKQGEMALAINRNG
jgi:hypothetical protein